MAVLLVEHDMSLVMNICDHVSVLDYGEVIARGDPATVQADPAVQAAYLGAVDDDPAPAPSSPVFVGAPGPGSSPGAAPAGNKMITFPGKPAPALSNTP